GLLRPGIPVVDVHVGAADRGLGDLDQHVVRSDPGLRNVLEPDPRRRLLLYQCFHGLPLSTPSSRPTSRKAPSACSSCPASGTRTSECGCVPAPSAPPDRRSR